MCTTVHIRPNPIVDSVAMPFTCKLHIAPLIPHTPLFSACSFESMSGSGTCYENIEKWLPTLLLYFILLCLAFFTEKDKAYEF